MVFITTTSFSQYNDTTLYINNNFNHNSINTVVCRKIINGVDVFNLSDWENRFLNSGFSVLSRNLLNVILDEQKLSLSDITNETTVGNLLNSDAIFIHSLTRDTSILWIHFRSNYKFISTDSGEIIFNADYSWIDFYKWDDVSESSIKYSLWSDYENHLIPNYKSQITNHK